MSYDRADYDLAKHSVRIAFFVAWTILNGLAGQLHLEDDQKMLVQLRQREITPGKFFEAACDYKFWEEDLNGEGNAFARAYYAKHPDQSGYFEDYTRVLLSDQKELRAVIDCWENYDKIAPAIKERYEQWKAEG